MRRNMRQIIPVILLKYMSIIEDGLMRNGNIEITADQIGATHLLLELKQLQLDYYKSLSSIYLAGETNSEIEQLLINDNKLFKDVLKFIENIKFESDLKQAFILNERKQLKKTFQSLDKETGFIDEDISLAFKLKERQNLKEQFKKIEEKILHKATIAQDKAKLTPIIPFNWKPLAIAATVVGLVLATTFIIIERNNKPQDIAGNKPNRGQQAVDTLSTLHTKYLKDLLAMNQLLPVEQNITVLKEQELGFAAKEEKITTRIYYLKESLKSLDEAIASEIKGITSGDGSASIPIKQKRDSLNNLANKYSFTNGTINIYLFTKKDIKIFKMDTAYYLIIEGITHECKKNNSLLPIKKVTDKAILKKTAKIIFDNAY